MWLPYNFCSLSWESQGKATKQFCSSEIYGCVVYYTQGRDVNSVVYWCDVHCAVYWSDVYCLVKWSGLICIAVKCTDAYWAVLSTVTHKVLAKMSPHFTQACTLGNTEKQVSYDKLHECNLLIDGQLVWEGYTYSTYRPLHYDVFTVFSWVPPILVNSLIANDPLILCDPPWQSLCHAERYF